MKPNPTHEPAFGILKTGTTISDSASWLDSLLTQIRELRRERKHTRPKVEITADRAPGPLDKLVEMPSPVLSLFGNLREAINDYRHPRQIESSVAPVEVEEIWSKPQTGLPRLLSIFVHVLVVALALVPWATSFPKTPKPTETAVMVYRPLNLILPVSDNDKSGGGGGGGKKTLTPPSQGRLPRPAEKQFVPPDPEPPKNRDPTLIVEPTVVAPQLAQMPRINLLNLGDPNGGPGPPSAGPGVAGRVGSGQGRGVGEGKGPGVGPGEGGGVGGGGFRVGGGGTPPTVRQRGEPQYSEEARNARHQ